MSKKDKDQVKVVRINSIDEELDEVFVYCDDPYVNEARRVKKGMYKLGATVDEPAKAKE